MAKDTGKRPAKKTDPDAVNERYRITIPEMDEAARTWAAHQSNLSLSVRILIRRCVLELGYEDVAMRELGLPIKRGPGRPRKDATKLLSGKAVPVPPRAPSLLSVEPARGQASAGEPVRQEPEPAAARPEAPAAPPATGTIDDMLRTGATNGRRQFQSPLAESIMSMGESDD